MLCASCSSASSPRQLRSSRPFTDRAKKDSRPGWAALPKSCVGGQSQRSSASEEEVGEASVEGIAVGVEVEAGIGLLVFASRVHDLAESELQLLAQVVLRLGVEQGEHLV